MLTIPREFSRPSPEEAIARPFASAMRHAAAVREESVANRLIAAAERSSDVEAWISRQIKAGCRPSEILAELEASDA
ncbi:MULTISPECIES: hypothetical protein [unclassified Mesorhizobium]|uniref:hypothetical protein n=1 Tax=unclassified Mesorhizobium TaxID=325217 RepID=UPI00095DA883|nr:MULTISPECIES: hypothetical protein [unclassified Mesorhizobium]MBN9255235.1 hypothetical protein [Mesorhizobium sp.]OJX74169.1 MAG: hypothetical protein BGO93_16545 [Mesorhizobium sp. 65-26]